MSPEFGGRAEEAGPVRGVWRTGIFLTLLLVAFGAFGLFAGTFAVLLADLSGALDLSPGPLGLAFFVGAAASILAMATLGWTADRLGRRVYLVVVGTAVGVGIVALAFAGGYVALLAALVILHAAEGLYDVGINAAAVDLENAAGRRFMAVLHAGFSAGGVVGALSAGALLSAGVDYRRVFLGVLIPLGAVILAVATTRLPPQAGHRERGDRGTTFGLYRNPP